MACLKIQVSTYHENCDLLGYYAASSGNFLQTFWDKLSNLSSGVKYPKKACVDSAVCVRKSVGGEKSWCQPIAFDASE